MSRISARAMAVAVSATRIVMSGAIMAVAAPVYGDSRTVMTFDNDLIIAATAAITEGRYREGIRLMQLGLDRYDPPPLERAAALSNLCAAHAAVDEPDTAIHYCTEALRYNEANWRTWSNRAFAYYLSGRYGDAAIDLDAAARLNPAASEILTLRRLLAARQWQS